MKKIFSWLMLATFMTTNAFALISTNEKYQLNNKMGKVGQDVQLGTLIQNAELLAGPAMTSGQILVGNSSNVSAAVAPAGDVTISNAGVTAIGAGKVLETMLEAPSAKGLYVPRVARVTWDPSGVSGDRTVAAHTSGVTIPANAVIRQVWFYTKTSLVSASNNGTIAVSCNSANDIFSAADIDATTGVAGQIGSGVETGTAANMLKVSTACDVTFTVAVNAFTAGKMDWFIEYVVAE